MLHTLLLASSVGFLHAFEADHLVAVSSIATSRNKLSLAIKDGLYWGIGHTSTILLVGCIYLIGKWAVSESDFHLFEAGVGLMLLILGIGRIAKLWKQYRHNQTHATHLHLHSHKLAYGVGALHGLAGSGAVLVMVLTQTQTALSSLLYMVLFGIGSVVGMMLVSGVFSLPVASKFTRNKWLGWGLSLISALLCVGLGAIILFDNIK